MIDDQGFRGDVTDSGFFGSAGEDGAEALDPAVVELVEKLTAHAPEGREGLIEVLLGVQEKFDRVSWRVQELVADHFALSPAQVAGVVSFFPLLSDERRHRRERAGERGLQAPEDTGPTAKPRAYDALRRTLRELGGSRVVEIVKRAGLQERGGAGFPVGLKWTVVSEAEGDRRYVVGHGETGSAGRRIERFLLEDDPHAVIEGMAIAAVAVGADSGRLFLRSEDQPRLERVRRAVAEARRRGFLGRGIMGSDVDFDVLVCGNAGADLGGEETAILNVIEGRRGTARPRPPFPALCGLWGQPTLVHTLETLAALPRIVLAADRGEQPPAADAKIVAFGGHGTEPGVVEVTLGTPVTDILRNAVGVDDLDEVTAVHVGGAGGATLDAARLDTPVEYSAVQRHGARLGDADLTILGPGDCPVSLARDLVESCVRASCGTCPPCRIGTTVMRNLLDRVDRGDGHQGDVDRLERLGEHIRRTALCEVGKSAAATVLTSVENFREVYQSHLAGAGCGSDDVEVR